MFAVGKFKADFRTIQPEIDAIQPTVHAGQAFFHSGHSRLEVADVFAKLGHLPLQLTENGNDKIFDFRHSPYSAATAGGA